MITVISIYNKKDVLENYLLKSLKVQTVDYELFLLDNTKGQFKSAVKAYNIYAKKAKGKYLMFVHQDVDLASNTWLQDVEKTLDGLPNLGIAGVAGKNKDTKGVITNIKHGIPPTNVGLKNVNVPTKVQTLDGCLIIIPKSIFDFLQFDENTCARFYYYAVDYCLSIQTHDYNVYVLPMFIYHGSTGVFSKDSYLSVKKLIKKHRPNYHFIYTTSGDWSTRYPLILQKSTVCHIMNNIYHSIR